MQGIQASAGCIAVHSEEDSQTQHTTHRKYSALIFISFHFLPLAPFPLLSTALHCALHFEVGNSFFFFSFFFKKGAFSSVSKA
jgi:hypothetical protein